MKHFWPPEQRLVGEDKPETYPVPNFSEILKAFTDPDVARAVVHGDLQSRRVARLSKRNARISVT